MSKPLLGVVHLQALPSAARHRGMRHVLDAALRDAEALAKGGVDGIVVENFGDAPFHKGTAADPVPPDVPAAMAVVARAIAEATGLPLCINVLRNDAMAALGVAAAVGARWIRVNVFAGAYVTDQGLIEGEAARVLAYRKRLGQDVQVLADFLVKHAAPLASFDVAAAAKDLAERSGCTGLVLSGARTGEPVDKAFLDAVRVAVAKFPIWIGSGLTPQNAAELWPRCDGAIVGTFFERGGRTAAPVDRERVRRLRAAVKLVQGRVPKQQRS